MGRPFRVPPWGAKRSAIHCLVREFVAVVVGGAVGPANVQIVFGEEAENLAGGWFLVRWRGVAWVEAVWTVVAAVEILVADVVWLAGWELWRISRKGSDNRI